MADFVNFQERLGMTDHQVLHEILCMRTFDKAAQETLTKEQYMKIAMKAARLNATDELLKLGATQEEADRICDMVDAEMKEEDEIVVMFCNPKDAVEFLGGEDAEKIENCICMSPLISEGEVTLVPKDEFLEWLNGKKEQG